MKASIVDLRYKMKDVLKALEANETVSIYCHGKLKGTIIPAKPAKRMRVQDHPFFGMNKNDKRPVSEIMKELRGGRYRDL